MIRVVSHRYVVQRLALGFCVVAMAMVVGCAPSAAEKAKPQGAANAPAKPAAAKESGNAAQQAPAAKPAEQAPAAETKPAEMKPAADVKPAQEAPAAKPADAKPADEAKPAEPKTSETSPVAASVAEKVANQAPAADMKPYTEKIPSTDVQFDMVPIPGGEFTLGSPDGEKGRKDDEGPQVKVKINPFWMGKCEVTWNEYELWGLGLDQQRRKIKNEQPTEVDTKADAIARPTKPYSDMTFGMGKEGYPAICMTQLSAKMYCKWLTAKTGHYYRLPTEAEWEYACRAGKSSAYSFGDDPAQLKDYAWSADNSDEKYHKVGQKKPNPWGLHDIHGNVSEWCLDEYVANRYSQLQSPADNPLVIATKAYPHVVRGGAWTDEPEMLRSAARRGSTKDWKQQDPQIPQSIWYLTDADFVGFRVVRPLQDPTPEEAAKYELDDFQKSDMADYKKAQSGKE